MPVDVVEERVKAKAEFIERAIRCTHRTDKCRRHDCCICETCDCLFQFLVPINNYQKLHVGLCLGVLQVEAPGRVSANSRSASCRESFPPQKEK